MIVKPVLRYFLPLIIILFAHLNTALVHAQILVTPLINQIDVNYSKNAEYIITNSSNRHLQIKLKLIDLQATENGVYKKPTDIFRNQMSAIPLLLIDNVNFTLSPGERRAIKLDLKDPNVKNLNFVEKRSHLLVEAFELEGLNQVNNSGNVNLDLKLGVSVPILVSNSKNFPQTENVEINNLSLGYTNNHIYLNFNLDKKENIQRTIKGKIVTYDKLNPMKPIDVKKINFFPEINSKKISLLVDPFEYNEKNIQVVFKNENNKILASKDAQIGNLDKFIYTPNFSQNNK